jgi:hypothetical protein
MFVTALWAACLKYYKARKEIPTLHKIIVEDEMIHSEHKKKHFCRIIKYMRLRFKMRQDKRNLLMECNTLLQDKQHTWVHWESMAKITKIAVYTGETWVQIHHSTKMCLRTHEVQMLPEWQSLTRNDRQTERKINTSKAYRVVTRNSSGVCVTGIAQKRK